MILIGVREYTEGYPVEIGVRNGRKVIIAENEGGNNEVAIDLQDLLDLNIKIDEGGNVWWRNKVMF